MAKRSKGRPEVEDKRLALSVRIKKSVLAEVKKKAKDEERSISYIVEKILRDYFKL
jgi:hypothetical protein